MRQTANDRRSAAAAAMLVLLGSSPAAAQSAVMKLPMQIGTAGASTLTVGQFLNCLEHDPIPLKLGDVSDEGGGRYIIRLDNDLQQYEMLFERTGNAARFVKLDRDNGSRLTAPNDLSGFVKRACRQANTAK